MSTMCEYPLKRTQNYPSLINNKMRYYIIEEPDIHYESIDEEDENYDNSAQNVILNEIEEEPDAYENSPCYSESIVESYPIYDENDRQRSEKIVVIPRKLLVPIRNQRFLSKGNFSLDKKMLLLSGPCHMNWNDYHRLSVIHAFMDNLEQDFPSVCTTVTIGHSLEGRELKVLKISNSDASNASVWLDAGIHAREWIAPAVATYIADHLARNFNNLPQSVTNKDWYFLPVFNPDGYEYSHTKERMWRKNRAWHGGQCVGVDLNRNFSYGWGGKGSSDIPTNAFYRGPEPFSEPESCAVRDVLLNSGIRFKIYITLHSYGQVIIFPFAFRDELCPDYVRLLEGATAMSKAIYETTGNTYKVGISRDVMYGAAGTSNDWSYGAAEIPYCYLIELRSKQHKFKLPRQEIEETGKEILSCVKTLMEFVDNYTESKIGEEKSEEEITISP
ncbi:hypothetical protein O3G_MSEX003729 [Manduca sexta]|uniref:Peptidase M14 domain-containing protein n=1 Tax=Manduca sexta TaxID=7130 RepID=A0A922CFJ0_MANSE|nr:hypothetical protein O3G_MSEX003729 [Manduca sexta]